MRRTQGSDKRMSGRKQRSPQRNGRRKKSPATEPIAIIGIGCRFPGGANSPDAFWKMLCDGVDAITEIPPDRWNIKLFFESEQGAPGKTYAKWGGFIDGIDRFDAGFFGISPREAASMDPQQRLLLEASYEAIEDAGLRLESLAQSNTGVYVGISTTDYAQLQSTYDDQESIETHTTTGSVMSIAANRISYCFDLKGPSVAVDTACSSSLVALHLACRSIWHGESDMALAGGVNAILTPQAYIGFSKLSMLSSDGRCKAFDATGNGFVRGEGVGVVVLKSLSSALEDSDEIYAVVRGTAVNQDGRTNGITVPSEKAQARMVREACSFAGIRPENIQYVEAHGTGTSVGDPIETNALGIVLGANRPQGRYCAIGSVKTNIGHLEAGAGIAGLIKTALCIRNRQLPPSLHFKIPNPLIDFDRLKLKVQQQLGAWPDDRAPLLAGVNSFGFGGTNAHALLSDVPRKKRTAKGRIAHDEGRPHIIPISARSPEALRTLANVHLDFAKTSTNGSEFSLEDIGRTASLRRTHHDYRLAIIASSKDEFAGGLQAYINGEPRLGVRSARASSRDSSSTTFVFSGQGPQWWAMGRRLLEEEAVFRKAVEDCSAILSRWASWSLLDELRAEESRSRMHETSIAQPAIFALQVGLAELWKSWGVEPTAVIGHSVGEVAAAHVAGILSLEDAAKVIYHRGRTMDLATSKGKMLGVGMPHQEAGKFISGCSDKVSIAAINSPTSVTLSGDPTALEALAAILDERKIFNSFLKVNYAFHSSQMDPVRDELLKSLDGLSPVQTRKIFYSTVLARSVEGTELDASYWWQNVRQTVNFGPGIQELIENGHLLFVELSAHPALSGYVTECLQSLNKHGAVFPSLRRKEDDLLMMLGALGGLYCEGYPVEWERHYTRAGRVLPLPRYPWQHETYWHECRTARAARLGSDSHPLLGQRLKTANPSWNVQLNRASFPYLQDHKVQGHVVFPAAGYIETAIALAREVLGGETYVIEDLDFHKALFLPEAGESPQMQTTFNPELSSFAMYAKSSGSEQNWTLHASGRIRTEQARPASRTVDIEQLKREHSEITVKETSYRLFAERGLNFGPSFQGIEKVWRNDGESLGLVVTQPALHQEGYFIQPATLDACLQVLSDALPKDFRESHRELYLPIHVDQITFYGKPPASLWSHAKIEHYSPRTVQGSITLYDDAGAVVARLRGLKGQSVDTVTEVASDGINGRTYEFQWLFAPRAGKGHNFHQTSFLPHRDELEPILQAEVRRLSSLLGWKEKHIEILSSLNHLCSVYVVDALRDLGWNPAVGDQFTTEGLVKQLGIMPSRLLLVERFLTFLAEDGVVVRRGSGWVVTSLLLSSNAHDVWKTLIHAFPAFFSEMMLLARCGGRLASVLKGDIDPLHLLFPNGSRTTVEHIYRDAPSFKVYNLLAGEAVRRAIRNLPESRKVRILEVGAGTAGTTSCVVPLLPPDHVEYVFTDVSVHFVHAAEQMFREYPFMQYKVLDIEKSPGDQGIEARPFDIILASDVLHATADLRAALQHVRELLASEGMLILLETDHPARWVDLTFGLTDGWWRFADHEIRPSYPLLARDRWIELLQQAGFCEPFAISEMDGVTEPSQAVFVARNRVVKEVEQVSAQVPSVQKRTWLIYADRGGISDRLARALQRRGDICIAVTHSEEYARNDNNRFCLNWSRPDHVTRLFSEQSISSSGVLGVIYCWGLDCSTTDGSLVSTLEEEVSRSCLGVTHVIQGWARLKSAPPFQLTIVTSGAQPIGDSPALSMAQTPLIGLARVIGNEHPDLHCKIIDLSDSATGSEIEALCEELVDGGTEDEIALRGEGRYVLRLIRSPLHRAASHHECKVNASLQPLRLETSAPGVLDNLEVRETIRRKPGRGEVEIQVFASALNFRDVLKALGIYPTESDEHLMLGDECAGVIVGVGEGVEDFAEGDEVIACAQGSLASFVTANALFVVHKPEHLSFTEATTVPVVFLTAYYALHHIARIVAGERVLVHAGAGGVGLAAIQLAQLAGAEVFATAGSEEKREFLKSLGVTHVMDSRSLSFADEIMDITGGRGVDVVLNSLAGEAIRKGMSCLAPFGRFVELGMRDIFQNTKVGLRPFKDGISFASVSPRLTKDKPQVVRSCLDELVRLFNERKLHPLPHRVFSLGDAVHAFKHMAQGRHTGKIVISFRDEEVEMVGPAVERFKPHENASYLVTGGLSGFGLATAEWLVGNGARTLVLAGRTGSPSAMAQESIERMRAKGATVVIVRADVSRYEDVQQVMEEIRSTLPPLRGIVHAAMVLDDGVLLQLTPDRFTHVIAPKVLGAWNLHMAAEGAPLDFFLLYSSVAAIAGNPGQANYVAANTFLDALAHHRQKQGLVGQSIAWGHVSDAGYVARNAHVAAHLNSIGLTGFSSSAALKSLGRVMSTQRAHAGIMSVDWRLWAQHAPAHGSTRFSLLLSPELLSTAGADVGGRIRDIVLAASDPERPGLVQSFLTEQVARVLGTSPSKLDIDRPLNEMGLDSLMMVELKNRIEKEIGASIPTVELMRGPTIARLSAALLSQVAVPLGPSPSTLPIVSMDRPEEAQKILEKIDELSEQEVDSLLTRLVEEVDVNNLESPKPKL
jgi:acyl transferase domain-containing protein/aryl carrier-like protein